MQINSKKTIILIALLLALVLLAGGVLYFYSTKSSLTGKRPAEQPKESNPKLCLAGGETAEYKIKENQDKSGTAIIIIKNQNTQNEKFDFQIDYVDPSHYHPIELHKCGVYVVRKFNYDSKKSKQEPGFKAEIWQYQYDGGSKNLITLATKDIDGIFKAYYSYDFRVDPTEHYISLVRYNVSDSESLDPTNYALVIKSLKTLKDVSVLPLKEIADKYPKLKGSIGFNKWTKDGRYFWANIFYGANVLGFIRINTNNWTYRVFPAPKDVLGGDALNVEKGYVTVHPGNVWIGITQISKEEKARRRKQGIGTELYVYNLFTGKRSFVDKTNEPLWYFKPKWISDTELEYCLPSGEKKVFKIE